MTKRVIGLIMVLAMLASVWVMPVHATAVGTEYDFEGLAENAQKYDINTKYPNLIGDITGGVASDLKIANEANGTYTNKYISYTTTSAQKAVLAGVTLEDGINVISMRLKFDGMTNELICLNGGSDEIILSAIGNGSGGGTVRALHDSSKALTLEPDKWFDVNMEIDTQTKTIKQTISTSSSPSASTKRGAEWVSHEKSGFSQVKAGAHIRLVTHGAGTMCIDDIKIKTVNDKKYHRFENFNQFGEGAQGTDISRRINLLSTQTGSATAVSEGENTYLRLDGGKGILHALNLYKGEQVWEMDIKLAPETHNARVFLHGTVGTDNTIIYRDDGAGGKKVQIFSKDTPKGAELARKLTTDFVKFTLVITRDGTNPISAKMYADGELVGERTDLNAGFNNMRFDLNVLGVPTGTNAADSKMYIDNIGCYTPGVSTWNVSEVSSLDIRDEVKVTVASNNIIDNAAIAGIAIDGGATVTPVNKNGGLEYDLVFTGLKPETTYNLTGTITDIFGNTLGTLDNRSFTTQKIERTETVYVKNSGGNNSNAGTEESPFKTIMYAASLYDTAKIILLDDVTENINGIGNVTIEGAKGKDTPVKLTIATETKLSGDVTIDNVNLCSGGYYPGIYACGHKLLIGADVTSGNTEKADDKRFSIYGGNNGVDMTGDTDITVLGGSYFMICGGGHKSDVVGNTNVVIGGSVNSTDSVDDGDTENYYISYAFGGGYQGSVSGSTNIEVRDSAKIVFVFGSGRDAGAATSDTNIVINGGKMMNVYGGALGVDIEADTKITMNGGEVEGIFGGSNAAGITGSAYIEVNGGAVTRRIYSGNYLNTSTTTKTVSGGTILVLAPEAELCTGSDSDKVIQGGSRLLVGDETNTVICTGGATPELGSGWDYIVKATAGGKVTPASVDTVTITPDDAAKVVKVNDNVYTDTTLQLSAGTTNISFTDVITIDDEVTMTEVPATETANAQVKASINMNVPTSLGSKKSTFVLAVYSGDVLKSVEYITEDVTGSKLFEAYAQKAEGLRYRAMLWDENMKPMAGSKDF